MKISLLGPKSDQSRREARYLFDTSLCLTPLGLKRNIAPGDIVVTPNQQRETLSGVILASTRRAEAILATCFVRNRLFNQLNHALSAAQATKIAVGSGIFISVKQALG